MKNRFFSKRSSLVYFFICFLGLQFFFQNCNRFDLLATATPIDVLSSNSNGTVSPDVSNDSSQSILATITANIQACSSNQAQTCVKMSYPNGASAEIWIGSDDSKSYGMIDSGFMGLHDKTTGSLGYFYLYMNHGVNNGAYLAILDLDKQSQVAWVVAPQDFNMYNTYFSYIRDSVGNKYPFLAPGAHYLTQTHWSFLCIFDPANITKPNSSCYTGFKPYAVTEISGYRHNGGWVDDINGDGWDDIHLPYMQYIQSLSGKTGEEISMAHFDVAKQSEPNSPDYFHSGRFYGSFTSFINPNTGTRTVLIASGNAVGTFNDPYCNVSRYMASFKWENTAQLLWSIYYSFAKTAFNYPYDSVTNYGRLGDDLNKCIHRFSDSMVMAGTTPTAIYSFWQNTDTTPVFQDLLLAEQASGFTDLRYEDNLGVVLQKEGYWTIQALNALDGSGINSWPKAYLWGRVQNFMPNEPYSLVAETFAQNNGVLRFDQQGHTPEVFEFFSMQSDFHFHQMGAINQPASRPKIVSRYPYYGAYPAGIGATWGGFPN